MSRLLAASGTWRAGLVHTYLVADGVGRRGLGAAFTSPDITPEPLSCRSISPWLGNLCGRCVSAGDRKAHGALSLQSCTQEIGEELVNGVIYSISLRKVQAHHGTHKGQRWLGVSAGAGPPPPGP